MPEYTRVPAFLRDDLIAQLRAVRRPLTTAQLCRHAAHVPVPGLAVPLPPLREQVYRVLCALHREGLITREQAARCVVWSAAPNPIADREIAALEAAFSAPTHLPDAP